MSQQYYPHGPNISCISIESIGGHLGAMGRGVAQFGSTIYPVANLALFIPFHISNPIVATRLFAKNGSIVGGNIDMAIYSEFGVKLTSDVHAAQAGANINQTFDIVDILLDSGVYYFAIVLDNIIGRLSVASLPAGVSNGVLGMAEMAVAYPLPAQAVFATCSQNYIPLVGLGTRSFI